MNAKEKISVIDNANNKELVAKAIADNIIVTNGLDKDEKAANTLKTWLTISIMQDSLADIIMNEQKVYVVKLAKKVAADICYTEQVATLNDFKAAMEKFGYVGTFLSAVVFDPILVGNVNEFLDEVTDTANLIGYEDTIIVDDTMYVYDNGERTCYSAEFEVGYHQNYTLANLHRRFEKRMAHKWPECEVKSIIVHQEEDDTFTAVVVFLSNEDDLDAITDKLNYRFGKTSGRPWFRCKLLSVKKSEVLD